MSLIRRIFGIFVMLAGLVGLLLSLAGLAGLWLVRPTVNASVQNSIRTLYASADNSQKTLAITNRALDASVKSVDDLAAMLTTTRKIVDDTQPVLGQVNTILGKDLPASFDAADQSLKAAQGAAQSLESAIKSFEAFQQALAGVPLVSGVLPQNSAAYNPDKSLSNSLGDLSASIEGMPASFENVGKGLDSADNSLDTVKTNLDDMSKNVTDISTNLKQYQGMINDSRNSMEDLKTLLGGWQANLPYSLNVAAVVLGLFFLWLLAAQIVIFSQGWELYAGTADRMEPARVERDRERPVPDESVDRARSKK
jgi:methyl-accepting chemotaxis protein